MKSISKYSDDVFAASSIIGLTGAGSSIVLSFPPNMNDETPISPINAGSMIEASAHMANKSSGQPALHNDPIIILQYIVLYPTISAVRSSKNPATGSVDLLRDPDFAPREPAEEIIPRNETLTSAINCFMPVTLSGMNYHQKHMPQSRCHQNHTLQLHCHQDFPQVPEIHLQVKTSR